MKERGLTRQTIMQALSRLEKFYASTKRNNRFLVKKLVRREKRDHLLMIIFEKNGNDILVITVIDTSKIEKYY